MYIYKLLRKNLYVYRRTNKIKENIYLDLIVAMVNRETIKYTHFYGRFVKIQNSFFYPMVYEIVTVVLFHLTQCLDKI